MNRYVNRVNPWRAGAWVGLVALLGGMASAPAAPNLARGDAAPHRGVWEVILGAADASGFLDGEPACVVFTRPDGTEVVAEAFPREDGRWGGRAYCDTAGDWTWRCVAGGFSFAGRSGRFRVVPSDLPGKLRKHRDDPHQFAYDNGEWFLHIGDTGYRFVTDTEPLWQPYLDEAARAGFTKIRTWFCQSRGGVEALLTDDRAALNLPYWEEIDRRLRYALEHYPRIQFQLIPYGEDTRELLRYGRGDAASPAIARYAQARFSALPNVHWCISNDRDLTDKPSNRTVPSAVIAGIGEDMRAREPWGTLLTNHQKRWSGYAFVDASWSDIITLEDLDQVDGRILLAYRTRGDDPVVNDEDRYGLYRTPAHDRYYFRRLMWASLLSGGHATYGGLDTYKAFEGENQTTGVQGYFTAVADGRLDDGAEDFRRIHDFFEDTGLTLVGFQPADAMAGDRPEQFKVAGKEGTVVVYVANPSEAKVETANQAESPASVTLTLPAGCWEMRWFDPRTGDWHRPEGRIVNPTGSPLTWQAPFDGDAVLLLTGD